MFQRSNEESVYRNFLSQNSNTERAARYNMKCSAKDSLHYVQRLGLYRKIMTHKGCVNTIHWNRTGDVLLSGSDDQCIAISNPHSGNILLKYKTGHQANIFSARFMPQTNDLAIVSCSGDGAVVHTEFLAPYMKCASTTTPVVVSDQPNVPTYMRSDAEANWSAFNCHKSGTTYEVLTVPTEPKTFLSCGEDGTVRFFDLRQISNCHRVCCKDNILILSPSAVNAMDLAPISHNYLAVGSSDAIVRIYDRRYLSLIDFSDSANSAKDKHTRPVKAFAIPLPTKRHYRVTCVKYNPNEMEMLASYSSEYLYLFDLNKQGIDIGELERNGRHVDNGNVPPPPITAEQVTRRLRLRGDWSDTGPNARPEQRDGSRGQARPQLQASVLGRMTDIISRMLNDSRSRSGVAGQIQERFGASASMAQENAENINAEQEPSIVNTNESATTSTSAVPDESTFNNVADFEMSNEEKFDYCMMKFAGHRNARTMIKEANFWGNNHVMCGSDCGHIFIWNKTTGKLVMLMQADKHVVNCLQPHPEFPYLASSGIDYDIKIWSPILHESGFDENAAQELVARNAVMLEQTKDTITVPAAFMIRMLACVHTLRHRENNGNSNSSDGGAANDNPSASE